MAGLKFIPALVRKLSDAEAEDAAITENLQREDVTPREEAAAYKRALESGRHTIESLVGKFGKSEAYIRSRLKLCDLIDALAEQLDREEISVVSPPRLRNTMRRFSRRSTKSISRTDAACRGRMPGSRRLPDGSTTVT